jgi:hypothetical protein
MMAPKVTVSTPVGHPTSFVNERHGPAPSGIKRHQDCCRDCHTSAGSRHTRVTPPGSRCASHPASGAECPVRSGGQSSEIA